MSKHEPARILHVIGSLSPGGIETWLLNVHREIDRERFQFDYLVTTPAPGGYSDDVRELGGRVFMIEAFNRPVGYALALRRLLLSQGPFAAIHSHLDAYSGFVLRVARDARVPQRIAHGHLDLREVKAKSGFKRAAYLALMSRWIRKSATVGLAASDEAGRSLYGTRWGSDPRWSVVHCGIDTKSFALTIDRAEVRAEFGFPPDALVVGHVGNFRVQKNHQFLLEVVAHMARSRADTQLLLVGDGPLRPEIEMRVAELDLGDRVHFAGRRNDVARLFLGAMDLFMFPSTHEGLSLALVEAQAAGLSCLVSDRLSPESEVIPELIHCKSLETGPEAWAESALKIARSPQLSQSRALRRIESSDLSIASSTTALQRIYAAGAV